MKPQPSSEESLFHAALLLPTPARAAFLTGACTGDPALRARLEALLAAHEQSETLMATKVDAHQRSFLSNIATAPDEAVGQMLGRYKLLQQIGEGGCGTVFMAEQTEPVRRRVALKVIKLGMDTKQVADRSCSIAARDFNSARPSCPRLSTLRAGSRNPSNGWGN